MLAAVMESPGHIVVKEIATPSAGPGEVLLKVEACAICGTDQRVLTGEKPVDVPIVGHEIAGRAVAVGAGVEGVRIGDRYAVQTVIGCNACPSCAAGRQNLCENGFQAIGYQFDGGFAEYMVMPKSGVDQGCLIPIGPDMPADQATILEPLSCCVNGMRCIPLEECGHVVVMGGGIIGTLNAMVARARGAKSITVMDVSEERLALHRKLGLPFDHWINSAKVDPVAWALEATGGRGVDAVVVAASVKQLVPVGLKMLARSGHLSVFAGMPKSAPTEAIDLNLIHYREFHVHGANSSVRRDYVEAARLIAEGRIPAGRLITHRFALRDFNQAVATAGNPASGALKIIIQCEGKSS